MKRSTAALAVLGIFVIGAVAGAFGVHLFYLRHLREPGGMARWGARLLAEDLKRDLDLTPEQARQVDAILLETRKETMAIKLEIKPEMVAALKRSRERIEAVLNPEQKAEYKKMQERRFKRFRHWVGSR